MRTFEVFEVGDRVKVDSLRVGSGTATVTAVYHETLGIRYHVNFDRHPVWAHFSAYEYELIKLDNEVK